MIWLYRLLFPPLLLLTLPWYLFRMLRRGGYGRDFFHRFGRIGPVPARKPGTRRIWIQAVSVGELLALKPLLHLLREDGEAEVVLTTTTSTGYRIAHQQYAADTTAIGYFPLDWAPFSAAAWNRIDPDLAVLMESELWPEHIIQASRRGVPIALINGRISNRSFSRYQRLPSLARRLLTPFHAILAASARDADRFLALGADPAKVKSTGNLKLDVAINPILTPDQITRLKADLGFSPRSEAETLSLSKGSPPPPISRSPDPSLPTSPLTLSSHSPPLTPASLPTVHCSLFTSPSPLVILGASTWPGEEAALVSLLHAALDAGIDCRLLLVPRHAERSAEIEAALADTNLPVHFRSQGIPAPAPVMIYVGDTTGELATLAQTADLVFIGKSLPPHTGGQTPIEAAALGKPILFGPGMGNFREISDALLAAGVAREVANIADLTSEALSLLLDPAARAAMAAATRQWHTASQGAARRTCAAIKALL